MRYWIGVGAGIGLGAIGGFIAGMAYIEEKVRREYVEANASYRAAVDLARKLEKQDLEACEPPKEHRIDEKLVGGPKTPAEVLEEEGGAVIVSPETIHVVTETEEKVEYDPQESLGYKPKDVNPYHEALEGMEDGEKHFTYLEEEDYQDEDDGFDKAQIEILMDDDHPVFLENGGEIDDWAVKIGENIMRDFYTLVAPNEPQVLYVRNHQMETDYEVIREHP